MNAMEQIEVDNKDRPIEDIVVQGVQIFVDPYDEADEQLAKERAAELARLAKEAAETKAPKKKKEPELKIHRAGVAKYLPKTVNK